MNVFDLSAVLTLDKSGYDKGLSEASNQTESFGSKLKTGIATAAKWGAAIAGGATIAGAALVKFSESSASTADNVDKMSQKIGISRQAYQELDFIFSQSGASVDSLQMGMKSLVSAMDGAASGTASNVEQFEKLGISVTNVDGSLRSSEDVMWEAFSALQGMENQTEKARLATELFGRSGTELLPMLNQEAGSMEDMKNQAHDLGLVLDDDLIDSGVQLNDTMDQLKRSFSSVATKLGGALAPIVEKVANYIIDNLPKIQSLFEKLEPIFTSLLESLLPPLVDLAETILPPLLDLIESLMPFIQTIISTILPIIIEMIKMVLPYMIQIVQQILPIVLKLLDALMPVIESLLPLLEPILNLIVELLDPLLDLVDLIMPAITTLLEGVANVIDTVVKPIIEWVADFLSGALTGALDGIKKLIGKVSDSFKKSWDNIKKVWSGAGKFFTGIWDGIKNAFSAVTNWFKDTFSNAWQAVKNVFSAGGRVFEGIKDGILSTFKSVVNAIIRGINKVITIPFEGINWALEKIRDVEIFGWRPFDFIELLNIPQIPELARGGILRRGQIGLLEGNGAEAVVPLEQNTEWTRKVAEQINKDSKGDVVIQLDEKSIYIENLNGKNAEDINDFVNLILEKISTTIKRKGVVFG